MILGGREITLQQFLLHSVTGCPFVRSGPEVSTGHLGQAFFWVSVRVVHRHETSPIPAFPEQRQRYPITLISLSVRYTHKNALFVYE